MVTLVSEWKHESKQEDDSSKYVPPDARDINKAAASGVTAWRRDGVTAESFATLADNQSRVANVHTHTTVVDVINFFEEILENLDCP